LAYARVVEGMPKVGQGDRCRSHDPCGDPEKSIWILMTNNFGAVDEISMFSTCLISKMHVNNARKGIRVLGFNQSKTNFPEADFQSNG
jgi:hypothetical protein